jgi:hypothetical protein
VTIGELIDFHLAIQQPGLLIGFDQLFADQIAALKQTIQDHYGSQEAWFALPEDTALPEPVEQVAVELVKLYEDWKGGTG